MGRGISIGSQVLEVGSKPLLPTRRERQEPGYCLDQKQEVQDTLLLPGASYQHLTQHSLAGHSLPPNLPFYLYTLWSVTSAPTRDTKRSLLMSAQRRPGLYPQTPLPLQGAQATHQVWEV